MSKKWFTSDLHFMHKNITKFTDRHDVVIQENHDDWLIDTWNSQVKRGDLVYHLGDFSLGDATSILKKLNGQKIFIKGNHDRTKHLDDWQKQNLIVKWSHYEEIKVKDTPTCLFHFPMISWHRQHYGALHLHGHCHSTLKGAKGKILDVGIDSAFSIYGEHILFDEDMVCAIMENKQININDHHELKE